jgi:glycerol-3-phosphate dehydrogenase (NAD+)
MPDVFNTNIEMYVFEETIQEDGKDVKLSEVINRKHENVKYLPGIKLPENINANPDLEASVKDADVLVFLAPHQFVIRQVMAIKDVIKPNAVPVSLIKGGFDVEDGVPKLLTEQIRLALGGARGETSVLMGANLANELAAGKFAESTLGSRGVNSEKLQKVFNHPTFKVNVVPDIEAVEICGALKNVVALAAGFSDGLDMGNNAKAAIIRNGLMEIRAFVQHFYPDTQDGTFFESAGVADLVTTCYGGRNRKCAEAFARSYAEGKPRTWDDISKELLNGQQLQGTLTAEEVIPIIKANNLEKLMPIHVATYAIAFENAAPDTLYAAMASV